MTKKATTTESQEETTAVDITKETAKTITTKTATTKTRTVVYIGPSIKNVIVKNIVLNNGLPKSLSDEIEKQPLLNNLIVPIAKLPEAKKELRNPKSALSIVYGKIETN